MSDFILRKQAAQERREYYRQWRAKNPDKVREINRRYWEKRAAKRAETESMQEPGNDQ